MVRTAILIDGGFYRFRGRTNGLIKESAIDSANDLIKYCNCHLADEAETNPRQLYRIFYYDCPPSEELVYHPYKQINVDLKATALFTWANTFYETLKHRRKVALRMGELANFPAYNLKEKTLKGIFDGSTTLDQVKESDFKFTVDQKGVDMRIGLDIASLAYKHQVDQIILIAGDSDFIPAVKLARREGIDVILDCMGGHIKPGLLEHVDGLKSHYKENI